MALSSNPRQFYQAQMRDLVLSKAWGKDKVVIVNIIARTRVLFLVGQGEVVES